MNKNAKAVLARISIAGLLGATLIGTAGSANAAGIYYSGRATVASVTVSAVVVQPKIVIGDTGELEPTGATRDATAVSINVPAAVAQVTAGTFSAYTSGASGSSASSTALQKVHVNVAGLLQVDADVVDADSSAQCNAGAARSFNAHSSVAKLVINGLAVANIQPNTTVTIPIPLVGAVTINEQTKSGASIAVNAIHIKASALGLAGADIIIGHAESGIGACP
jgi:hypothetical protein